MKFDAKIKSIEYRRWIKPTLCPGSLMAKTYFTENDDIQVDYHGIYDWEKIKYIKKCPRTFLYPEGQK